MRLNTFEDIARYVFAGNATFTLENDTSHRHLTFKVEAEKDKLTQKRVENPKIWFVKAMTGPDNETAYTYIGFIRPNNNNGNLTFMWGSKSPIGREASSVKAMEAYINAFIGNGKLPKGITFHGSEKCCRCGRKLTVPESCTLGIGPECREKMGL
jgi:hypothetical protein